jgi:hypothetical protein
MMNGGKMDEKTQLTRLLLACGIIAGPIYILVGLAQILVRDGFDVTRHPLSLMSNGDLGWIQIMNFVLTGILVVLGAMGLRRALPADKRWRRAVLFIGLYGVCVIGGGVFVADPALGFPPGTPDGYPETMSWHGLLHFVFGQLGFLALIIASFIFARFFAAAGLRGWAAYSAFTGSFFLAAIVASIAVMGAAWTVIALYVAVALGWMWLSALSTRTLAEYKVITLQPAPEIYSSEEP